MADEKDPKKQNAEEKAEQAANSEDKPKRTRRRTASSAEKKPARSRTAAKAKADDAEAEPKAEPKAAPKPRRRAAAKPKAKPKAEPKPKAEEPKTAPEEPETKAPARRRTRPAAEPKAGRPVPARPVVTARARYVRSSARKARLVIDHVRGKPIGEARALLRHSPRGVARDLERLLDSAIANAENNHDLVGDDLYVKEIYADEGPTLKRFRARAQGRAYRIRKRTSHLTVALTPKE
jgi:ribosomal protein L22